MSNKADAVAITDEGTSFAELGHARLYVWNTGTLVWERMVQPGGSGGGGAVTVANGADVAQGNTADAAWVSGSGTVISLLKKIASAGGSAVSVADGADVAQGTTTDLSSASTVIGLLKAIKASVGGTLTVAAHAVTQSGTWTVQPGNTANTTAWKVDGSAVTQPVSGTVTANAGTNMSTAALALDATLTGGTQKTKLVDTGGTNVGSISAAGALKVDNSAVTQPVSGTVTTNTQTGGGKTLLFAAVSVAASGANSIVAADATRKIKVVSYVLVADAAVTAKWQNASTDISGAMSFAANGGASAIGTPESHLMETSVNQALNLNLGGAVGVRGHISYFLE